MEDRADGRNIPLLMTEHGTKRRQNDGIDDFGMPGREDAFGMPIKKQSSFKKRSLTVVKQVKSRKHGFLKSLIHIPALAITGGILSLTFRNVFWKRPDDSVNVILNSLQFAAQFHGSFMIASMSAILLHIIHHHLVGTRGVPLGFVGSVFQLNMISYLFQREFYTLKFKYILLFLPASLLVVLAGPASAITMLPRLQFWAVPKLWIGNGNVDFHVYMQGNEKDLFPETLTAAHIPPNCFLPNASVESNCPSSGMRHWMMNNDLFQIVGLSGGPPAINRTIEGEWIRYMVGQTSGVNQGISSVYAASTLSNFFGNSLFAYEDLLSRFGTGIGQNVLGVDKSYTVQSQEGSNLAGRYDLTLLAGKTAFPSRKPLVEVECSGNTKESTTLPLAHDRMMFPPWTQAPISSQQWSVQTSNYPALFGDLNSTIVNSSWINNEQFGDIKPSLGAIFSTPEVISPGSCFSCAEKSTNFSTYTCTIDARWMATKAFTDASTGARAVLDFAPNPFSPFQVDGDLKKATPLTPLYLAESWTKSLDVPWIDSISQTVATNRTVLDTIGQRCLDSNTLVNATYLGKQFANGKPNRLTRDPMSMTICLEVWLSIYLTEAISHTQDSIPAYFVIEGHDLDISRPEFYKKDVYLIQNLYDPINQMESGDHDERVKGITKAQFQDPTKYTEIRISTSRWGYGYGFQDSKLIYVGVVLLLLHVAICIVYVTWIMSRGDYRSAGWDSVGGLISMALRSGNGADQKEAEHDVKKKWSERFVVREVTKEGTFGPVTSIDYKSTKPLVLRMVDIHDTRNDLEEHRPTSDTTFN